MRFEKERPLRQVACEAIGMIQFTDKEVVNTMQDMLLVEENETFRRTISNTLREMGSEEMRNESMIKTLQERVKQLCSKDNVLFQVLTGSDQSLLDLYTAQHAVEKNDNMTLEDDDNRVPCICESNSNTDNYDQDSNDVSTYSISGKPRQGKTKTARAFDATLEAYRARQITPPSVDFPNMQPSFIPYWTESNESI